MRACNFHLSALRHIRSLVSDSVAQQIACSIVGSRLDYCNSLLVNCSNRNPDKLQHVQDNLAHVVCNSNRSTSGGPLLRSLQTHQTLLPGYFFPTARLRRWSDQPIQSASLAAIIHTEASVSSAAQRGVVISITDCYIRFTLLLLYNLDTAARRFSVAAPRQLVTTVSGTCRHWST